MKKIKLLIFCLLPLLLVSCFNDDSTTATNALGSVVVNGFDSEYNVYAYKDNLTISPTVNGESQYDYYWLAYSKNFDYEGSVPQADTLAYTKDLQYKVELKPGQYILVFNVFDKKTTVTTKLTADLNVSTLNMKGWYLYKSNNDKADFDFIYDGGRIDNWINFYNGKSLEGNAIKSIYASSMKPTPISSKQYEALFAISEQDAGIFRVDDGEESMNASSMFFAKPDTWKPQNILQPMNASNLVLINDNKIYNMMKGGRFNSPSVDDYSFSSKAAVGALLLGFDDNKKSFIVNDAGITSYAIKSTSSALLNTNANIIWMAGYCGSRSAGMALLKYSDGTGNLIKLNMNYMSMAYGSTPYLCDPSNPHSVSASHGLMKADVISGNYDNDFVYYAIGNKVYLTDVISLQEKLQITLPDNEQVSCMQHIKYPDPPSSKINVFAVASYNGNNYTVRYYDISSIGELTHSSTYKDITGTGKIKSIIYMEQGKGSKIW
jgi:hypothetical protein